MVVDALRKGVIELGTNILKHTLTRGDPSLAPLSFRFSVRGLVLVIFLITPVMKNCIARKYFYAH